MTRGFFRYFAHDHRFEADGDGTVMRDTLVFRSKFGPLAPVVDPLILGPHLRQLLSARNEFIRQTAESDDWGIFLSDVPAPQDSEARRD